LVLGPRGGCRAEPARLQSRSCPEAPMFRRDLCLVASSLLLILSGCASDSPMEPLVPDTVLVEGLEITAEASRAGTQVEVVATLRNTLSTPKEVVLYAGGCTLLLRFWRSPSDRVPMLDEAPPGFICADIGSEVIIPPGEAHTLVAERTLSDLRSRGLSGNRSYVTAVVPSVSGTMIEVAAGWVPIS